jgi:hypothetical protein
MEMVAVLVVMATIFVWGVASARLIRADLTAPIVRGLPRGPGPSDTGKPTRRSRRISTLARLWKE